MARVISLGAAAFEGGDFTPIPAGTKVRVSLYEIEEQVSKSSGKPQLMYTVKVTEDGPFKGREIRYNYQSLQPAENAAWALKAFADALGWKVDEETKAVHIPESHELSNELGKEFIAAMRVQPDRNDPEKLYNSVGRVYPLPKGGSSSTPAPAAFSFDSV